MDAGSLTAARRHRSTWKLKPEIALLTQGLVVNGFGHLPTGRALFLRIGEHVQGGGWLTALERVAPVTAAVPPGPDERPTQAAALALTWTALSKMKLPDTALASFSRPFREGMFQADRLRRLGDRRRDKWLDTVIAEGPLWSANTPLRPPLVGSVGAYDVKRDAPEEQITTRVSVDALLLLYTLDEEMARLLADAVAGALQPFGVSVVRQLELVLDVEGVGISREHFGFADGLSQPEPFDEEGAVTLDGEEVREGHPVQSVALGEFVIGYLNGITRKRRVQ